MAIKQDYMQRPFSGRLNSGDITTITLDTTPEYWHITCSGGAELQVYSGNSRSNEYWILSHYFNQLRIKAVTNSITLEAIGGNTIYTVTALVNNDNFIHNMGG